MTAVCTAAGIRHGLRLVLPLVPSVVVFGLSFGAVAARTGLGLGEAVAMSALVYAGASQFAALAAWQGDWTLATAVVAVAIVATVNSRFLLMGAALRPWFEVLPTHRAFGLLAFNTDASWLAAVRSEAETGRRDIGVYIAFCGALWVAWVASTIPGWWLGALVADPRRYAIDIVMLVFFAVMIVPLWRGPAKARPWAVAAAVALLVQWLVPGQLYILAGTLAGALAGAFLDDRRG